MVDCCIARDEARAQWEQVFATQLQGLPILRVIVTHMHPDHIGLADWLCKRWNAPLWISSTDYHVARVLTSAGDTLAGGDAAADFFASHGLTDPEAVGKIRARTNYYANMVPAVPAALRAHARRRHGARSAATPGAASPATAMRRSTSRCTAPS